MKENTLQKLKETAERIRTLKVQGAISISLAAANAMEAVIEESDARTKEEFIKDLEQAGQILIETRPSAVALPNAVNAFIKKVKKAEEDLPNLKKAALRIGRKLIEGITEAVENIGKIGADEIQTGMKVLIHCHSSTVMAILKEAWSQEKRFEVICTETRPWGQGYISARELSDFGITTTLIVDSAVMSFIKDANLVLVGADTITKDGCLINKIGTSQIALMAKHFDIPLCVATETLKFDKSRSADEVKIEERPLEEIIDPKRIPKARIRNPVFDITKPEYIAKIITERGLMSPSDV